MVDGRFKRVKRDLAFRKPNQKDSKTVLDERFAPLFEDARFTRTLKRDVTGRGMIDVSNEALDPRRHLVLDTGKRKKRKVSETVAKDVPAAKVGEPFTDSASEDEQFHWDASATSSSDDDDDEDADSSADEKPEGKSGGASFADTSSRSSSSSDDDSSDEENEALVGQLGEEVWTNEETAAPRGDPSRRVAILGLDWDNLCATDLLVMCRSALSDMASDILKVSIYPSEFGMKRLEQEKREGPRLEALELAAKVPRQDDGEIDAVTALAIRKYQKERAQYYYAIVECSSVEVGDQLYEQLDGMDADFCVDGLDLRFVPDDIVPPFAAKDESESVSEKYSPPSAFSTALKHSRAKLNWDETPAKRVKLLRKKFSADELARMDLKEYLASSAEEDDEEDAEDIDAFRKALLGDAAAAATDETAAGDDDDFFVSAASEQQMAPSAAPAKKRKTKEFPLIGKESDEEANEPASDGEAAAGDVVSSSSEDEGRRRRRGKKQLPISKKKKGGKKNAVDEGTAAVSAAEIIRTDPRFAALRGKSF